MTKKNLIILIILLAIIDLAAAGWYMSRRIEAGGTSTDLFEPRGSSDAIAQADTTSNAAEDDVFDDVHLTTYYYTANSPSIAGDPTSRYTSIKHVKVRWPKNVNGDDQLSALNKELIKTAFGNTQSELKAGRYTYLNKPNFNKPVGDDYKTLSTAPAIYPVYGNVSQVLVFPYMTSQRLLVMEVDKVEYNGTSSNTASSYVHYDRQKSRVLARTDILATDAGNENKLLKVINKKIDELNKERRDSRQLQHALNVPGELCCTKNGVLFMYKNGTISSEPTEILVGYDKMEDFFTKDFKQLVKHNNGYYLYPADVKPEPVTTKQATSAPQTGTTVKQQNSASSGGYVKPTQTKRKRYNGATHKPGRRGRAARRQRIRHQR